MCKSVGVHALCMCVCALVCMFQLGLVFVKFSFVITSFILAFYLCFVLAEGEVESLFDK